MGPSSIPVVIGGLLSSLLSVKVGKTSSTFLTFIAFFLVDEGLL